MPRVHDDRQVQPALGGADVGDVAHPEAVARIHFEHAVGEVDARIARLDHPRPAMLPRGSLGLEPRLSHDVQHSLLADHDAVFPELAVDATVTLAALVDLELLRHEPIQRLALYLGVRFPPLDVAVVFGLRDPQDLARLPDGAELAPMRFEELAPRAWP